MNKQDPPMLRRLTENEAVFREYNEKAGQSLADLDAVAAAHDDTDVQDATAISLQYFCECSDENCRIRIAVPIRDYQQIHQNRSRFVVAPGHEVTAVESIVSKQADYYVVEKFHEPSENPAGLASTDVENTPH